MQDLYLKKLEKLIKKRGYPQIAIDLGYRSTSTIYFWIRDRRIPRLCLKKVEAYLKEAS